MTLIQVEEYGLALILWIASAVVLLSKAIHWQGAKAIKILYLIAAILFVPLSVWWTNAKRDERAWSNLLPDSKKIAIVFGPPIAVAFTYSLIDDHAGGKCLEPTPQFYWLGLTNNSDQFVSIQHIVVESKTDQHGNSWIPARVLVPSDNVYGIVPVFIAAPPIHFAYQKTRFKSLLAEVESGIPPKSQKFGALLAEPLGSFPSRENLYESAYKINETRVSVQDSSGRWFRAIKVEKRAATGQVMRLGVDVPQGAGWTFDPVDETTANQIRATPTCSIP